MVFSKYGNIKDISIFYDKVGNNTGNAELIFNSKIDALKAVSKLDNINADGKLLSVKIKQALTSKYKIY